MHDSRWPGILERREKVKQMLLAGKTRRQMRAALGVSGDTLSKDVQYLVETGQVTNQQYAALHRRPKGDKYSRENVRRFFAHLRRLRNVSKAAQAMGWQRYDGYHALSRAAVFGLEVPPIQPTDRPLRPISPKVEPPVPEGFQDTGLRILDETATLVTPDGQTRPAPPGLVPEHHVDVIRVKPVVLRVLRPLSQHELRGATA